MKKSIGSIFLAFVFLPVLSSGCAPASTPVPPTSTPLPTNTPIPPTLTPTPTLVPSPTATPIFFPPIESFVGIWLNTGSNTGGWPRIVTASEDGTLFANFRDACDLPEYWFHPIDCDGGLTSARYSGNPVLMFYDYGSEEYNITLSLNGDTLHVTTFIHYTDNSGRADETLEYEFRKQVYSFPLSEQIVFYYFVQGGFHFVPEGSVLTPILLFTASSDEPYTSDTAADLRTALELVLQHERNGWEGSDLEIIDVTLRNGHADIVLQGEYFGESDKVLSAASLQILLTVFANPSVQTAAVTLNGDTIGNLGVSSSTNAKPADYVYTRAEIETYLKEHAFVQP